MAIPNRREDAILTRNWNLSNASSWTVNFWKRPITATEENAAGTPPQDVSAPSSNACFLEGLSLLAVTGALSLAVFLVAMDVNIIVTAVPRITNDFQSLHDIGWYGSAFLMTACVFQIPFGRFYSLFAIKFVFLAAVFIFMAGSLVAGLAPKSPVFILGRAVQGIGASGILSGGLIIMAEVIPVKTRPYVGAIIGALEGVAMISGPILGGVLAERLHWRWCFYINLPIGGLVLATIAAFLNIPGKSTTARPEDSTWEAKVRRLDPIGFFFLLPSLVCLLLGIQYGGTTYAWSSSHVILLLVLGILLFVLFAYSQYVNSEIAMIPTRILKQRSIIAGFWHLFCTSSALVVVTYFLPFWFQEVRGSTPIQSGIALLPMLAGVIVALLVSSAIVSGTGYYAPMMIAGSVWMSVGSGMLSRLTLNTPAALVIVFPALFGVGVGLSFQQPLIAAQTVLSKAETPTGMSIMVFGQTLGAAMTLSVGETVFLNRLRTNLEQDLGLLIEDATMLSRGGFPAILSQLPAEKTPLLAVVTSKVVTQTFYVAVALAALSIVGALLMEWKSVRALGEPESQEAEA